MDVDEVISKLKGISCGNNPASCSGQFAKVFKKIKKEVKITRPAIILVNRPALSGLFYF